MCRSIIASTETHRLSLTSQLTITFTIWRDFALTERLTHLWQVPHVERRRLAPVVKILFPLPPNKLLGSL